MQTHNFMLKMKKLRDTIDLTKTEFKHAITQAVQEVVMNAVVEVSNGHYTVLTKGILTNGQKRMIGILICRYSRILSGLRTRYGNSTQLFISY